MFASIVGRGGVAKTATHAGAAITTFRDGVRGSRRTTATAIMTKGRKHVTTTTTAIARMARAFAWVAMML